MQTNYKILGMDKMILNIDVPKGLAVDIDRLTSMATDYIQNYIYMLQKVQNVIPKGKNVRSLRNLRGCLSSDKTYQDMVEEALLEKYSV